MPKIKVKIEADMVGVGEIREQDTAFLLVKRNDSSGSTISREQYPAKSVVQEARDQVKADESGVVTMDVGQSMGIRAEAAAEVQPKEANLEMIFQIGERYLTMTAIMAEIRQAEDPVAYLTECFTRPALISILDDEGDIL